MISLNIPKDIGVGFPGGFTVTATLTISPVKYEVTQNTEEIKPEIIETIPDIEKIDAPETEPQEKEEITEEIKPVSEPEPVNSAPLVGEYTVLEKGKLGYPNTIRDCPDTTWWTSNGVIYIKHRKSQTTKIGMENLKELIGLDHTLREVRLSMIKKTPC